MLALGLLAAAPVRSADPATRPAVPPASEGGAVSDTDARIAVAAALGDRLFKLGRYEDAVAEYRRAYELRADPRFLYHIAECYRELGATEQALFYYERFLAGAPNAPERDDVLDKITELDNPRRRRTSRPKLVLVPDETVAKTPPRPRPWQRWWFWTALGVVVTGGVTAALLSGGSQTAIPSSDLGGKRFY